MRKSSGFRVLWLLALFFALAAISQAEPVDPAEKVARLAALKVAYREEVRSHGFDSDKAKSLRDQIAALDRTVAVEPGAAGSAAATPPTAAPADAGNQDGTHFIDEIKHVDDYDPNAKVGNPCGAYAVTTILNSFDAHASYKDVYNSIVPIKFGTSPHDIKTYLEGKGHGVSDRNNGSLDDIAAAVDRHERVLMLLNVEGSLESLHWAAVKGYKLVGGKRVWVFEDTYFGSSRDVPEEDLSKMWHNPCLGAGSGFNNYYMTVSKDPPGFGERLANAFYGFNGRSAAEVLTSGLRDVTRGGADTFGGGRSVGQRVGGFFHMVGGGVFKVAGGFVGAIPTFAGNYVGAAGDGMMGWGADKWKNGGIFGKVAGAGATVLGAITKGAGWILTGAGALVSGICGAVGDAVGAVGDAIGGAIDTVGSWF